MTCHVAVSALCVLDGMHRQVYSAATYTCVTTFVSPSCRQGPRMSEPDITVHSDVPVAPASAGFSGTKAASIVGITYRQLDYWARTDLVRPSLSDAAGSGSRRAYSYRDLLELRVIKSLLDAGIKLESVRLAFGYLRQHVDTDIASAHLVISGADVILCDGDQLVDVMRRGGQGVLNVLALGGVKRELDVQLDALQLGTYQEVMARADLENMAEAEAV